MLIVKGFDFRAKKSWEKGAFVNALRIGNVRSDDVMMAQRMLMASGCGTVTDWRWQW